MALVREYSADRTAGCMNWHTEEKKLLERFYDTQQGVHRAFCDSLDTPRAMASLLSLVSEANVYLAERTWDKRLVNTGLMQKIAGYITHILRVRFKCPELMINFSLS
jgi:cysteinyl-tRNA synthetase